MIFTKTNEEIINMLSFVLGHKVFRWWGPELHKYFIVGLLNSIIQGRNHLLVGQDTTIQVRERKVGK